ncbi:hypothetical protein ES706_03261 [subsurface metagenome]
MEALISLLGSIATTIPRFIKNQRKLWNLTTWEASLSAKQSKLGNIERVYELNLANLQSMVRVEVEKVTAGVHWKPQPALRVTFRIVNWSIFKIYWDKFLCRMNIDLQGISYDLPPYLEKRHSEGQSPTNFEVTYPLPEGLASYLSDKEQERESVHFGFTGHLTFRHNSETVESDFATSYTFRWP